MKPQAVVWFDHAQPVNLEGTVRYGQAVVLAALRAYGELPYLLFVAKENDIEILVLTGTGLEQLGISAAPVHQCRRAADQPVRNKKLPLVRRFGFRSQSLGKLTDGCHGEEAVPPGMIAGMNHRRLISGTVSTRLGASQSRRILCV